MKDTFTRLPLGPKSICPIKARRRRALTSLVAGCLALFSLNAAGINELLDTDTAKLLQDKGSLTRAGVGSALAYFPKIELASDIAHNIAARPQSIAVESLFLLKNDAISATSPAELDAQIYNTMTAFSSLKGLNYWSASQKKMRLLYKNAYQIANLDSTTPIPDPPKVEAASIPQSQSFSVMLDDTTTGLNQYSYSFFARPGTLEIEIVNPGQINYGIFRVFKPGDFYSCIVIAHTDDGILFYLLSLAKAPGLFQGKLKESLWNRAVAMFALFEKGLKTEG